MNNLNTTLTLFFTGGVSLKTWEEVGNLDREIELYKRLSNNLKKVNIVTYGGSQDRLYSNRLGAIKLLPLIWYKRRKLTIFHLMMKHYSEIRNTDILKTNQILGSDIPIWFKEKFGKKLIVRCGYLYSYVVKKRTKNEEKINNAVQIEKKAFSSADIGIVSSPWQRDIVITQYNIEPSKIKVIPNYVVSDVFKPDSEIQKKYDLIFVGRDDKQKNLDNLLKAIQYIKTKKNNMSLLMVGDFFRDNDSNVKDIVERYNLDVTFKNNIPNFDLPNTLNQAKVFILPSYYEGHPKVLLEAMSCGMPCIGTKVRGIEDIEHMKTGYLCDTNYESIANAIETVSSNESLQMTIGKNAREFILKKYALDRILEMELDVIRELIAR